MEVKDPNSALLSNYEVHKLLLEIREEGKRDKLRNPHGLSTIVYETLKYLNTNPGATQTPEVIAEFCRAVAPFKLTKAEKLQILNLRPSTPVEIQLIVEECEERLSEEKVHQLTEIIARLLPIKSDDAIGASSAEESEHNDGEN